jgi:asparagine synthase (glutamine-hydrolysing)
MCGIAGVLAGPQASPPDFDELRRMIAMLAHRGPDGHGLYRDDRVGLAHARLSIVDLAGGAQPLANGDGSLWISFNGEVFNHVELRRHLRGLGHQFQTNSDTEVIVHAYERWGTKAWPMLNGQFAFALWDGRKRQLWLVRDRLGILPLFWAEADGHVVFGSEAKALFAGGRISPSFDRQSLVEVFTTWAASAPRTVFEGVRQVPPATALCFDDQLHLTVQRYWQPDPHTAAGADDSPDGVADALEAVLGRSVELRLRADVPVGAYVSGGLDSSVISSLARQRVDSLETFGIRFEDPRFDETTEQRVVAAHLGTRHHEIMVGGSDLRASLAEVVWHLETPTLRTSPVPLFLLSKLVRESGIKTVLTGEGADELLAGYTIFKEDQIRRFWARRPDSKLRPALLSRIHHYIGGDEARANGFWRSFFGKGLEEVDHPFYSHLIRWRNTAWTLRLLAPELRQAASLESLMAEAEADMPAGWRDWDPLVRAQVTEIRSFMSSYLLSCQGDRVAMAHGIEARYPFLDPDLVDFCLSLPKRHKLMGTRDKIALRRVAARHLPESIWARRKQPFRAPIGQALFGPDAEAFHDLLVSPDAHVDQAALGQLLAKAERQAGNLSEREEMGLVGLLSLRLLGQAFGPDFAAKAQAAYGRLAGWPLHVLVDHSASALATPASGL